MVPELESAAAELLGGRLALGLGFEAGASERFEKARDLACKSGAIESKAEAFMGLAWAATKNEQKAEHYEAAAVQYESLGDGERAMAVRGVLEGLP